jgi:hypothetical protein
VAIHAAEDMSPRLLFATIPQYSSSCITNTALQQPELPFTLGGIAGDMLPASQPIHCRSNTIEDFVCRTKTVNAHKFSLPAVIVQQRGCLLLKAFNPASKDLRVVVFSLAMKHSSHELLPGHCQLDHAIKAHCLSLKKLVERCSLPQSPGETIEKTAAPTI